MKTMLDCTAGAERRSRRSEERENGKGIGKQAN